MDGNVKCLIMFDKVFYFPSMNDLNLKVFATSTFSCRFNVKSLCLFVCILKYLYLPEHLLVKI